MNKGKCEFCEANNVELVARLIDDPDQKVCRACHNHPHIPTKLTYETFCEDFDAAGGKEFKEQVRKKGHWDLGDLCAVFDKMKEDDND